MRRWPLLSLLALAAPSVAVPLPPGAAVVDCAGRVGFTSIQAAIDASVSGDRIVVAPCVYHERIDFHGKRLDVSSLAGPATTILDGDGGGTVVKIRETEGDGTRLAGFTIRDGQDDDDGSGIELRDAAVELDDLVLTDNDLSKSVIFAESSFVTAVDVTVSGNDVAADGQAIWSDGGSIVARGLVVDCDGGAEAVRHHGPLILHDSTLTCDTGVGLHGYHGEDRLRRSTFLGATAGIHAYDEQAVPPDVDDPTERLWMTNCVAEGGDFGVEVAFMHPDLANVVLSGGQAALSLTGCLDTSEARAAVFAGAVCGISSDQPFTATESSFWQNQADGCGTPVTPAVRGDPRFVSATDVHLRPGSPLIDAGPTDADLRDVDGSRNDIGAYGGPFGDW